MLFHSYIFVFVFLPLTLIGYYGLSSQRLQLAFLFGASLVFYSYWNPPYVLLLLFTVILDFSIARAIFRSADKRRRKTLMLLSVGANLGVLAVFKYFGAPWAALVLPIGISFYTFQSMSYVIDVFRGTSAAHPSFVTFAAYVSFFPHQIAGPLVRHNAIVPQLENEKTYSFNPDSFWKGCCFFILGLSKKLLLADQIGAAVDPLVVNIAMASNSEAIFAVLGYGLQIYFDFSGYSDMAVGLGLMMNIRFPQNFNSPYKAVSIADFWQRWHISLSSWFRDYLYIPLGGNRLGAYKTYRNLLLTMLIGGVWHGASWTFAVWGLLHGLMLVTERFFRDRGWAFIQNRFIRWALTFALVNIGWIFFRSPDFATAFLWLRKALLLDSGLAWHVRGILEEQRAQLFFVFSLALLIALFGKNTWERKYQPIGIHAIALGVLFFVCLIWMGEGTPFLYFRF